ncbi:MAG: hypothetical protein WC919_00655 [Candidatus Paceibacterota bacterium]|jgi:hypothetical protein
MTFEDLWREYEEVKEELNAMEPTQGPVTEQHPKIDELRVELRRKAQAVMGHYSSFRCVKCWMVDAVGHQTECDISPELVAEIEEDATHELGHKYVEKFGALPSEVREVMSKWDLTDSGGGCGSWHLGCHCTDIEAKELCRTLHERFQHAIDRGILTIRRSFWSLKLR